MLLLASAVFVVVVAGWLTRCCLRHRQDKARAAVMHLRGQAKVAQRDNKKFRCVQSDYSTTPLERKLVKMTAGELIEKIKTDEVSSEDAIAVFANRSYHVARKQFNLVTEEFYDEALTQAKALDARPENKNSALLYGLPVSVKDCFVQKDADATCGMAAFCGVPGKEDGLYVRLTKLAGAIPFVRSNVPQQMMLPDCENLVWGRSTNPWDPLRVPGGSSGGEAGILAARCSLLGMGGDIGGSLRIPASFCGITAFKGTPARLSNHGRVIPRVGGKNGQRMILSVAGPMATCVEDLNLLLKAWLRDVDDRDLGGDGSKTSFPSMHKDDPYSAPVPWDEARFRVKRKLRVGFFETDGWFYPCATSLRAVRSVQEKLTEAGHHVKKFTLPFPPEETCRLYYSLQAAEGNMFSYIQGLQGENLAPNYSVLRRYTDIPNFIRPLLSKVLALTGEVRRSLLVKWTRNGGLSARQYWALVADLFDFREKWVQAMKDQEVDILLCPSVPLPAFLHGQSKSITPCLSYMFLFNLLHWPSGTVTVTQVEESEQQYWSNTELPKFQRDSLARDAQRCLEASKGMPISVQLAALPFQDEACLAAMREVEELMQWKNMPPCVPQ
eukprot:m.51636 g.51636  ORF g.51636 m.51636 type:complete len:611 (-) comp18177_c0_seq1:64-1896(-)